MIDLKEYIESGGSIVNNIGRECDLNWIYDHRVEEILIDLEVEDKITDTVDRFGIKLPEDRGCLIRLMVELNDYDWDMNWIPAEDPDILWVKTTN